MTLSQPPLIAADFEGVFIPEIWIAVADCTGIPELRKTTRDISDYDKLMAYRLAILDRFGLTLTDIQAAISQMEPLPGAHSIMKWLRRKAQFIILTDSYYQFVAPFMPKLDYPTIFAHQLTTDSQKRITGYHLRIHDSKRKSISAFRAAGFRTMAFGDSYNDTSMLLEADRGVLFRPPVNVVADFPQLPVVTTYTQMQEEVAAFVDIAVAATP